MSNANMCKYVGGLLVMLGIVVISWSTFKYISNDIDIDMGAAIIGVVLVVLGIMLSSGMMIKKITIPVPGAGEVIIETATVVDVHAEITKRTLEPDVEKECHDFSKDKSIPGSDAAPFELLEQDLALQTIPCADPMTPMYMLDAQFRIIDWNDAFTLAFNHTMEGRRFESVLEWVYFLENYQEVINHGIEVFGQPDKELPRIDIEEIKFKSRKYGSFTGTKRAYQIPTDDGQVLGWLVTIDPTFSDNLKKSYFYTDLFKRLRQSMLWSEYALSYDRILMNTNIYRELLGILIGENNMSQYGIEKDARIIDLGAGTGNLTKLLADTGKQRMIVSLDNNDMMLKILRSKCKPYLCQDSKGPGVLAIKQDIGSLFGIAPNDFDYVMANNVLYTLSESSVQSCLQESYRVLKKGGEIRIGGPKKEANLDKLFNQMERELKNNGKFNQYKNEFNHVKEINYRYLSELIHRWDSMDMIDLLQNAGFKETYVNEEAYAGQSRIIFATKEE